MIPFVEQMKTELAIHQIAQRMGDSLERDLRWSFPEGWRKWVCIALGLVLLPVLLVAVVVVLVREWPTLRVELDGWEWAQAVLKMIYLLIFSTLWCWGLWELVT